MLAAATTAAVLLTACWAVEIANYYDDGGLDRFGIRPRDVGTAWHVFSAPFLHASIDHIVANSMPLLILAFLAALPGVVRFLRTSLIIIVASGIGVWLLAPAGSVTLGASGLIFGYFGYLVARGLFERRAFDIVVAAIVAVFYGAIILSALPNRPGVSWQAHLFGLTGGVAAAYLLRDRPDGPRLSLGR